MASCLGIYIDRNVVKYAKVKRRKNKFKIESFGINVFEDFEEGIEKVISETNSFNIPICVNISNEIYNYFEVYSELEKKDIIKSLEIEFEKVCSENNLDTTAFESRFLLTENTENYEKFNSIYISTSKNDLQKQIEVLSDYKLICMSPISISLTNLLEISDNENFAIINLENDTKITTIVNGQIDSIEVLKTGLFEATEEINENTMSWKKAYGIYKNITLYNYDVNYLADNENEYIDFVMPVLEKISNELKIYLKKYENKLNKIYISGMGALINNIELYFQNALECECEVLKPYFIDSDSAKYPVKEYIEVNSAIALAIDGIEYYNDLNFAPFSKLDDIEKIINSSDEFDIKDWKEYLKGPYDIYEKTILRGICACIIAIILFVLFSLNISKRLTAQTNKINQKLLNANEQIEIIDKNIKKVETYDSLYKAIINKEPVNSDRTITKDSIPNLLNKIMFIIPKDVQITGIKNSINNHIIINAISENKEDLETFYNSIKADGEIIKNIEVNYKNENNINYMTIEGDII